MVIHSEANTDYELIPKGTVPIIQDSFSKTNMMKIERGSSGAARLRRIPLVFTASPVVDTHGSLTTTTHVDFANAATTVAYCWPVVLPTDYVNGGFPSIKYTYSSASTTGNVRWVVTVKSFVTTATATTSLLSSTVDVDVPSVANTLTTREILLTTRPEINTQIAVSIQRTDAGGEDTSTGAASVWAAWLEYLAFY